MAGADSGQETGGAVHQASTAGAADDRSQTVMTKAADAVGSTEGAPLGKSSVSAEELTPTETAEARWYHRRSLQLMQIDFGLDLAFWAVFGLWVVRPLNAALRDLGGLFATETVRLVVVFLAMTALHVLVAIPLTFYREYLLEHRVGLSTLTPTRWAGRYLKRLMLSTPLSLAMILGLFWLFWLLGCWWWPVAGVVSFLLGAAMVQWFPVVILPLFYPVRPIERPSLRPRAERLASAAGLTIDGIYRIELSTETVKANAMLAGLGRTRRVLLGDTLLDQFTDDEIEVVLAHEVGHHAHRHISKMLVAGFAMSMVGFWLTDVMIRSTAAQPALFRYTDLGPTALPWLMMFFALWVFVSEPAMNLVSRFFERQADRYALRHASRPIAFFSAFRKLARLNKEYPDPDRWEVILYYSHPPIAERLELAQAIVGKEAG